MSLAKNIKTKNIPKAFRNAAINEDLKKYKDSPVYKKKVEDAKKFLANFNFK